MASPLPALFRCDQCPKTCPCNRPTFCRPRGLRVDAPGTDLRIETLHVNICKPGRSRSSVRSSFLLRPVVYLSDSAPEPGPGPRRYPRGAVVIACAGGVFAALDTLQV